MTTALQRLADCPSATRTGNLFLSPLLSYHPISNPLRLIFSSSFLLLLFDVRSVATRQLFCADDWAQLASETHRRGLYVGSRGHFRLPQCERLPRIGSSTFFMPSSSSSLSSSSSSLASSSSSITPFSSGGERERSTCSRAHLTQLIPAQVTSTYLTLLTTLRIQFQGLIPCIGHLNY